MRCLRARNALAASLIFTGFAACLSDRADWSPASFPNPTVDTDTCGRRGVHSWICDPDGVISYDTANIVEGVLKDIADGRDPYARAPCGEAGRRGYQIAVALMRKMQVPPGHTPTETAERFAKSLHDKWGVGLAECSNGVLLLLSVDDRQVYISTGVAAAAALSDKQIAVLIERMKPRLREEDYDTAVETVVREMGLVLAGGRFNGGGGSWLGNVLFAGFVAIFVWALTSGIRDKLRRRREYSAVTQALEKLKREQAQAQATQRFPERSCPVCMEDFTSVAGTEGGSSSAVPHDVESDGDHDDEDGGGGGDSAAANPLLGRPGSKAQPSADGPPRTPLVLPCGHVFCTPCLERWMASNTNCPICRAPLTSARPPSDARRAGQSDEAPQPTRPEPRSRFPHYQRCWSRDAYMDEFNFRLLRLQGLYPYYMTDPLVWALRNQAARGQAVDWETVLRQEMRNTAERARLEQSGRMGTMHSFGGGHSGGGGGGGGSW